MNINALLRRIQFYLNKRDRKTRIIFEETTFHILENVIFNFPLIIGHTLIVYYRKGMKLVKVKLCI